MNKEYKKREPGKRIKEKEELTGIQHMENATQD